MKKNSTVSFFLQKGYLLSPGFVNKISKDFNSNLFSDIKKRPIVLNSEMKVLIDKGILDFNWFEFEKGKVSFEKNRKDSYYEEYVGLIDGKVDFNKEKSCEIVNEIKEQEGNVIILKGYEDKFKKRMVSDFVTYYRNRFESIKKILVNRPELQNLISISKLKLQQDGKSVVIMGLISSKNETKNGNIILELEDTTGKVKLIISKNKKDLYALSKDLVLDEIVGIVGINKGDVLFVNNVLYPDVPSNHEIKKSPDEAYAVFISDTHFGLKNFLEKDFNNFINWLNGNYGSDKQKEISKKIKYLFIAGDLVDGVGIYPNQDKDLIISEVNNQFEYGVNFLSKIPDRIKIIICAGNHDPVRMSEPQPILDERFCKSLLNLKNVILVTNPSLINIHATESFPGFNILLYHGFSFPYYAENVESIYLAGGQDRPDLIMQYLLQKRHLAPTHSSNLYIPDVSEDALVIDQVPDFFVSGHIHKIKVSSYKGVTCINASCWVTQTEEQERRGIHPEPSRAVVVNLKTRDIKVMNFGK